MTTSLRIAFVISHYPPTIGGLEIAAQRLARALVKRGHRVSVYTRHVAGQPEVDIDAFGVAVHRTMRPIAIGPLWGLTYMAAVRRWLRREGPFDVIHCHQAYFHTLVAQRAARPWKAAVVNTLASSGDLNDFALLAAQRGGAWIVRKLLAGESGYIALASAPLAEAHAWCDRHGCPLEMVTQIPNFIDAEHFSPQPEQRRGIEGVFVGRLVAVKNVAGLLAAFAEARSAAPTARISIVGDGELRAALETERDRLGLRDAVEFVGAHGDVRPFLRRASFAVSASRVEGMSNALLEQLSCGLPAIMPDVGGVHDALNPEREPEEPLADGVTRLPAGLVTRPADREALARALRWMLESESSRAAMAERARQLAERHFSEAAVVPRLEEFYRFLRARR